MDEATLKKWLDRLPPEAPTPVESDAWSRAGRNAANLPSNIAEGLTNTLGGLVNPLGAEKVNIPNFFPEERPASSFGEMAADVTLGPKGLADILGQSMVEVMAAGGLGRGIGMTPGPALESLKWGAGFALPETQREGANSTDVGVAGALGAASGPLMLLNRKQRILPTALMALLHGTYEADRHDPTTGLIAGAVDFAGTMLPGGLHRPQIKSPITFGLEEGINSLDNPKNVEQHTLYKAELARMQSEQAARAAEQQAYEQGSRGSLKEGIRLLNPESLPDRVPLGDLTRSFEASLPDPMTASGKAMRSTKLEPESFDPFATLQTRQADPMLLDPPNLITGVEPRPNVSLLGDPSPNPGLIFPVEGVLGARRSDKEIAKALKLLGRKIPTRRGSKPRPTGTPLEPEVVPPIVPEGVIPTPIAPLPDLPGGIFGEATAAETGKPFTLDHAEVEALHAKSLETTAARRAQGSGEAMKVKLEGAPRKGRKPKAPAVVAEPAPPPAAAVIPDMPFDPERAVYLQGVYGKMGEQDLRAILGELDNELANTLDEASRADYRGTRSVVESILNERVAGTPTTVSKNAAQAGAAEISFAKGDRVTYRDALGQEQHGSYLGKNPDGSAKIKFDGEAEVTPITHNRLAAASGDAVIPELATLQNAKRAPRSASKIFNEKDEDVVARWLSGEQIPDLPDSIPESIKGQDFEWSLGPRVGTDGTKLELGARTLPEPAVRAVNQITEAIRTTVSKYLKVKFAEGHNFKKGQIAGSDKYGDIRVNIDSVIEKLDGWQRMGKLDRARALADVSRWIGHEAGHTILSFMQAKNPRILNKLLEEFRMLGPEGRLAVVKDYHSFVGAKADQSLYASGHPFEMSHTYGFEERNIAAMEYTGLHEFFSEMSAAHIFGKLKAEMLPPEMQTLWGKFKSFMKGMMDRLFKSDDPMDFDTLDEQMAYQNFKEIVANLHDRFSVLTESEYAVLREKSAGFTDKKITKLVEENAKIKQKIAEEDYQAAVERAAIEARDEAMSTGDDFFSGGKKVGQFNSATGQFEFATLQSSLNSAAGGMRRAIVGNQAFIEMEMVRHLGMGIGGAVAGGIMAPKMSNGQITVAEGVFAGGILGLAGPVALKRLLQSMPKINGAAFHHIPTGQALKMLFTSEGRMMLGGDAANGMGSAPAQFVRWMERNFNMHLPRQLFNAVVEAEGPASYAVQIATDAFKKARNFETTPQIDAAVESFLRNKSTAADLRQALGANADAQHFANFIVTGRESIGLLQGMFASGLRPGQFKNQIIASLQKGDYLVRQYKMFHDPSYKPTQSQIEALSMELSHAHPEYDLSTARIQVEDYLHQIQVERGQFKGGRNDVGQKLDSMLFARRNDRLSGVFRDALGEYTDPKEKVMATVRHLYTNAISSKFYDHVSNMTDAGGLKMSYTTAEHGALMQNIEAQIRRPVKGTTPEQIATLQRQQRDLQYFVPLDPNPRYGKIAGTYVNRFVRDQLASFDSPWGLMDGAIMRSMSQVHNAVKIGRTAFNPITVVRNIVSAPVLMGLAKANPIHALPGGAAWKAMRDINTPMGREMLEQGIIGVDQVRGEFFRSSEALLMGDYDHKGLTGALKTGLNSVLEFYRAPDTLVRGATYITAKARFAKEFGLGESDRRVIDAARDWTNRYTVNYANIAPAVKSLRQIPFTNLFISYTAEVTRIAKNLVEDVFTHKNPGQRMFAAGAIGGLVTLPFLWEKQSLNSLSPKDKEEWLKSQAQMPDYSRSRFRIVTGKEGKNFRYVDVTPILQIDSILQMLRTGAGGDWKGFLATNPVFGWENTPLLNIAAEQITGQDLRTGRDISSPINRVREIAKELVPPIAPGGYEWQRGAEAFTLTEGGERGISNLRTGRRTTPDDLVKSYLTGMRFGAMDTNNLHRNVIAQAKRSIANEASYLRDVTNTDLPRPAKEKAIGRYKESVAHILEDMRTRLGGELP